MAEALIYTARDLSDVGREQGFLQKTYAIYDKVFIFPDCTNALAEQARDETFLTELSQEYHTFQTAYVDDHRIMVELYTIQRYLQMNALQEQGLQHFDSWAANYGETVTAIELSPEGTGYRAKTRFAKFYNLPELMSMFKNVADIQTADMLKLPVPEAHYHNIALKPSEFQKEMVANLAVRAEQVRNRVVDSSVDNMLLITNDGRKLALDQRLINPMMTLKMGYGLNTVQHGKSQFITQQPWLKKYLSSCRHRPTTSAECSATSAVPGSWIRIF